jgi:hypothetical protein
MYLNKTLFFFNFGGEIFSEIGDIFFLERRMGPNFGAKLTLESTVVNPRNAQ